MQPERHTIAPGAWFAGGSVFAAIALTIWGVYGFRLSTMSVTPTAFVFLFGGMAVVCLFASGREYFIREGIRIQNEHDQPIIEELEGKLAESEKKPAAKPQTHGPRVVNIGEVLDPGRRREIANLEAERVRAEAELAKEKLRQSRDASSTPEEPSIVIGGLRAGCGMGNDLPPTPMSSRA